jgi:hypothetical protein
MVVFSLEFSLEKERRIRIPTPRKIVRTKIIFFIKRMISNILLSRNNFKGKRLFRFLIFCIYYFYLKSVHSNRNVFISIDCNSLFCINRENFGKIPVYVQIRTLYQIDSRRESKSEIKILISIDSRYSTFFQWTDNSNSCRGAFIFENNFRRVSF